MLVSLGWQVSLKLAHAQLVGSLWFTDGWFVQYLDSSMSKGFGLMHAFHVGGTSSMIVHDHSNCWLLRFLALEAAFLMSHYKLECVLKPWATLALEGVLRYEDLIELLLFWSLVLEWKDVLLYVHSFGAFHNRNLWELVTGHFHTSLTGRQPWSRFLLLGVWVLKLLSDFLSGEPLISLLYFLLVK